MTDDDRDLTGFEQLLGTDAEGAVVPGAGPVGAVAPRTSTRTVRPVSGGTHRAAPRRAPLVRARRGSGWATPVRAAGTAAVAGAVLLLASIGSGAIDLSGASSDSMLAVVAPGVASALGQPPGQGTGGVTDEQDGQAVTTWLRTEPSSSGATVTSPAPTRAVPSPAPPTGSTAPDDVAAQEPTREPQVAKPAQQSTPAPAVVAAPVDEPAVPAVPVVTAPAPTTVPDLPEPVATRPEVTGVPEATTTPELTTAPEPTTPTATATADPVATTPSVEPVPSVEPTPSVDTTGAEVTAPSAGDGGVLVALTLGGIGLGTAGRHAVRRGRHRAAQERGGSGRTNRVS